MRPNFDLDEIRSVVDRVRDRFPDGETTGPLAGKVAAETASEALGEGIFSAIDGAVEAAWEAQKVFAAMGLKRRYAVIGEIRRAMSEHGAELARAAHQETGLGRAADKTIKNRLVTEKTPGPEDLEPEVATGDDGQMLTEYAPFGVIGSISPTTNPTSTIINNTIAMVSAGNGVVFNVHPSARVFRFRTCG